MCWNKIKPYLYSVLIALGVGGLSGFITRNQMQAYDHVQKSNLTPPSFVFPIVWTILFILMGVSAAMIWKSGRTGTKFPLLIYGIQLVVNFIWSILFFNMQAYLFSLIWLILLLIFILVMIYSFSKISWPAALLQIPYLVWVTFAGYLNFIIWYLNR